MNRRRRKVIRTCEEKERAKVTKKSDDRETDTRVDDTPAVPNEPTDHAVARGRDVSLRFEGGHSPENHTVVLETTDGPQRQRPPRPVLIVSKQNTLL